jgi:hypothetical protein
MKVGKIVVWSLAIIMTIGLCGLWYVATYSMGIATEYEVNEHLSDKQLLIVTQQSDYKDSLTTGLIAQLAELPVNIVVIDLTTAANYQVDKTIDACILMHTWEMSRPPGMVSAFRERMADEIPLFVISTSGSGEEFLDGDLDGISSASAMIDANRDIQVCVEWAKLALGFTPDTAINKPTEG